jgi:hypothetical protein
VVVRLALAVAMPRESPGKGQKVLEEARVRTAAVVAAYLHERW